MTSAKEWRQSTRKTLTLPSGKTVVIRKLTQRDYFPRQLANVGFDVRDEEKVRAFLAENPSILFEHEDEIIIKAMVEPRVALDADPHAEPGEAIHIDEIETADRGFLVAAIADWSGMTVDKQTASDNFRQRELETPGPDGKVLQEATGGTPRPDA